MAAQLIDGKAIAKSIQDKVAQQIKALTTRPPGLAFVLVGEDPASQVYVNAKKKKCAEVGILSIDHTFPADTPEAKILHEIHHLNHNPAVDGILVQLPLPRHISAETIMEAISPQKDVDGFHSVNIAKMYKGHTDGFFSCTPHGIITLLSHAQIPVQGKHVVIVGRSAIVGKPLALLFMQKLPGCNATVTVANSYTEDLKKVCRTADILIAAIGHPQLITGDMVKPGAVVIDVGINRMGTKLVGDVDFDSVSSVASYITPVPGGVGPMTIAMLLSNTLLSRQRR